MDIRTIISSVLLLIYLLVRFCFTTWLDSLGGYSSYIFEAALVLATFFIYCKESKSIWKWNKQIVFISLGALLSGFIVFKGAVKYNIPIPFDLEAGVTIVFLLGVGPILEEGIFRFFAWQPLEKINRTAAWIFTSLLFSYSHYHSIWFVPEPVHSFINYQTIYTIFLGLACGYPMWKYRSLLGAILIHFAFNFGFYLGSQF